MLDCLFLKWEKFTGIAGSLWPTGCWIYGGRVKEGGGGQRRPVFFVVHWLEITCNDLEQIRLLMKVILSLLWNCRGIKIVFTMTSEGVRENFDVQIQESKVVNFYLTCLWISFHYSLDIELKPWLAAVTSIIVPVDLHGWEVTIWLSPTYRI